MNGRIELENKTKKLVKVKLRSVPSYVEEWYYHLEASGLTAKTCNDYITKLTRFLYSINEDICAVKPSDITSSTVDRYFVSIRHKIYQGKFVETSGSYRQTIYHVLNNFFKFMNARHYINENYLDSMPCPKNRDLDRINGDRILLTKEDFINILKSVDDYNSRDKRSYLNKIRDKLIIHMFMITGMRESALVSINIDDFDYSSRTLVVIDKGNKRHEYVLPKELIDEVVLFANGRTSGALFVGDSGKRISVWCIINTIKKYSKLALGYEISPHKLRSGFCSILYDSTHDIEFVRRSVGHSNVSTTQRYIVRDNRQDRERANEIIGSIFK